MYRKYKIVFCSLIVAVVNIEFLTLQKGTTEEGGVSVLSTLRPHPPGPLPFTAMVPSAPNTYYSRRTSTDFDILELS